MNELRILAGILTVALNIRPPQGPVSQKGSDYQKIITDYVTFLQALGLHHPELKG